MQPRWPLRSDTANQGHNLSMEIEDEEPWLLARHRIGSALTLTIPGTEPRASSPPGGRDVLGKTANASSVAL